jgi:hypothetical protein
VKKSGEERGGYGEKVRVEEVERDGKKGGRREREIEKEGGGGAAVSEE